MPQKIKLEVFEHDAYPGQPEEAKWQADYGEHHAMGATAGDAVNTLLAYMVRLALKHRQAHSYHSRILNGPCTDCGLPKAVHS